MPLARFCPRRATTGLKKKALKAMPQLPKRSMMMDACLFRVVVVGRWASAQIMSSIK